MLLLEHLLKVPPNLTTHVYLNCDNKNLAEYLILSCYCTTFPKGNDDLQRNKCERVSQYVTYRQTSWVNYYISNF